MKDELLPSCTKNFVSKASSENLRLDGRGFDEFRTIEVHFGKEWGSVQVSFGETKVVAKATCDVQLPKTTRPNEGLLHLNVELSPMAAVHFESGPPSDLSVHINRLLEKFFKESRCVDLESLCIVAEEKVWNVRVDVNILNSDGNLIGCCSAAALAALMHFRRPDFTLSGEQVIIHSFAEKDPLPISLHHHPVAVVFAVFNNGEKVMVDPCATEEKVSQAQLVLAINSYRELCGLHLSGTAMAAPELILQCAHKSAKLSAYLITKIKGAIDTDMKARNQGPIAGLSDCIHLNRILSSSMDRSSFHIKGTTKPSVAPTELKVPLKKRLVNEDDDDEDDDVVIIAIGEKTAELQQTIKDVKVKVLKPWEPSTKGNQWIVEEEEEEEDDDEEVSGDEEGGTDDDSKGSDSEVEVVKQVTQADRVIDNIELSGDSEEEETLVLKSSEVS